MLRAFFAERREQYRQRRRSGRCTVTTIDDGGPIPAGESTIVDDGGIL